METVSTTQCEIDHAGKIETRAKRYRSSAVSVTEANLARVRIMYWKEIPVQVQAQDDNGQVSAQLEPRFQEAADAVAMMDGSYGSDAYLDAWGYGEFVEITGEAKQAADDLADKFNKGMPADFVARIRDLEKSGDRDERPGAIDSWAGISI